jgi:hypothetical protein
MDDVDGCFSQKQQPRWDGQRWFIISPIGPIYNNSNAML